MDKYIRLELTQEECGMVILSLFNEKKWLESQKNDVISHLSIVGAITDRMVLLDNTRFKILSQLERQ